MNPRLKYTLLLIGLGILLIAGVQSSYLVQEKDQVIITQFGRPVGDAITEPGFYLRIPFMQKVNYFEKRFMEWDGDPNQVPTKDKKYIFVDTYARWQITDPLLFYKRLTNERGAQSRLDDILDGETRNIVANHNIEELVRNSNRAVAVMDSALMNERDSLMPISVGRDKLQHMIMESANKQMADLGIVVLDFRFKRISYVDEVQAQVFERMKSERIRIAEKFRSEGSGEASKINGEKERDLKKIQSEAFRDAEEIKGRADAEAANIYAAAYNQTAASRELYGFLKSLETLELTLNEKSTVVISTDSELYQYLKGY
ncbi:MAG: protease modulator HflC [Bacteroidetes bacterium]|jgi:membrane protease subunit HflC|nr:protease modulator HflC [Bacteroidota bacterium]